MKKRITRRKRVRQITRRELVGGALAAAGVLTGAPAFLRGQNLNNKLNIAMIACGGRARANMNGDGGSRRRATDARSGPPRAFERLGRHSELGGNEVTRSPSLKGQNGEPLANAGVAVSFPFGRLKKSRGEIRLVRRLYFGSHPLAELV